MDIKYKQTVTYHGRVDLPIFGGYLFNHGTETYLNDRTASHRNSCNAEGLTYIVFYEEADRLFGTDIISPSTDKEYVKRVADRLNTKYLSNSSEKALLLRDWFNSLGILSSISRGYYDALRKADLSETECIFVPACITQDQLQEAIDYVNKTWFFVTKSIRISAKAYRDKTESEKKMAAKPMPEKGLPYILNQLRHGKKFIERFSLKSAVVQSILYAWTLSNQPDFGNLQHIRVIITADDKSKYKNLYNILVADGRFELVECESDADVIEEYKNIRADIDIILMNPPYSSNLHLKILEDLLSTVKSGCIIINISPIRWLQDPRALNKNGSDFKLFKDTVYKQIKAIQIIPSREGNSYFGIVNTTDLGIYTFDDTIASSFTGVIPELFVNKILPILKTLPKNLIEENKQDGWRVRIPLIMSGKAGGRGSKKWYGLGDIGPYYNGMRNGKYWYEFYTRNQYTKQTPCISLSVGFGEDQQSAVNFDASLKTIVGKYITFNLIPDVHVSAETIMWLDDYHKNWTDAELCKHFNLTGYISDTEAVAGSDWEEILNFIKENDIELGR